MDEKRLKDDEFRRARGGAATLLTVSCAVCASALFRYQKDGDGPLFRCYLDRINNGEFPVLASSDLPAVSPQLLTCPTCGSTIGELSRYREGRLAFLLYQGMFLTSAGEPSSPSVLERVAASAGVAVDDLRRAVAESREALSPTSSQHVVREAGAVRELTVFQRGQGPVHTPFGVFEHRAFIVDDYWRHYSVLSMGDYSVGADPVLLRIDSGCQTGQLFADLTCECWEQLIDALRIIGEAGVGVLVVIPDQDGRGMGLGFKLATLRLQDELGITTVEAAEALAGTENIDIRTYSGAAAVLEAMGLRKDRPIILLSNNPRKAAGLSSNGYEVAELRPLLVPATAHTRSNLMAKGERLGHLSLLRALKHPAPDH
jgi:GTP cyclohydrolase II